MLTPFHFSALLKTISVVVAASVPGNCVQSTTAPKAPAVSDGPGIGPMSRQITKPDQKGVHALLSDDTSFLFSPTRLP